MAATFSDPAAPAPPSPEPVVERVPPGDAQPRRQSGAPGGEPGDPLRGALLDSRQRWRDLVTIAADFAFETDAWGRFVFVTPDPALGWTTTALLGQPWTLLIPDSAEEAAFNPFRTTAAVQHRPVWVRRADGSAASLVFAAAPLLDATGGLVGVRGLGIDLTVFDRQHDHVASALRRGEVLDHILWGVGQEVLAPRMMRAALNALVNALGAEGGGVIILPDNARTPQLMHGVGGDTDAALPIAAALLETDTGGILPRIAPGERPVLVSPCQTRFGERAGLAIWRAAKARPWDEEDRLLVGAASSIVRMILEQESIQREMARQARTDSLTGLLNRRAFLEELERRTDRLDRERLPGTLIFADLDNFKPVNDLLGHEMGDQVLVHSAILLRRIVRPSDLVARLGGDEFAVWLDGADHMTAAERAEALRQAVPGELADVTGPDGPLLGMSIGIACRQPGTAEPLDRLMRRADMAMYDVKRNGRGHWRVSQGEDP